eukprot:m.19949 g.19949  ORF g.19949 m.19949 type:complete len:453 (-) comp7709_c0_seq2:25-1383(-)
MSIFARLVAIGWGGVLKISIAAVVVILESIFRIILYCLPTPLVRLFSWELNKFFPSAKAVWGGDDIEHVTMDMTTAELIAHFGYPVEEHMVYTDDGYVLALQRIPHGKNVTNSTAYPRPAVLLMHGLMQNSEVWVCWQESLAFTLADSGFDVWLGNVRGNKYSCKHKQYKPHDSRFWDFSLDEFALHDLPATINHVLATTGLSRISYVGFSQGTGAAFASFSLLPQLAEKIALFVALAPAAKARGLKQGWLQTFINMAPESLFLIFGTRTALSISLFWRSVLPRRLFANVIDGSCKVLFEWHMRNIGTTERKALLYPHLFSLTSVKTVAHWLQIAACDRFQQYDENQNFQKGYRGFQPQGFPVHQIKCKMALFYGGSDALTDIQWLLGQIPADTHRERIDEYEHMDLIWARDAHEKVFPKVVSALLQAEKEAMQGQPPANPPTVPRAITPVP